MAISRLGIAMLLCVSSQLSVNQGEINFNLTMNEIFNRKDPFVKIYAD